MIRSDMQERRVLDVGQCSRDHGAIRRLLASNFGCAVDRANTADDALRMVCEGGYALVLVNRILDADGSEGLDLIRRLTSDARTRDVPVMLVSNYAEAQAAAVQAGARRGFGKAELDAPETIERIRAVLG